MVETIMSVNWEPVLNISVAILSILGGVFGGIPTVIKWIKQPSFRIKDFDVYKNTIHFKIGNAGKIWSDVAELKIKCLIVDIKDSSRFKNIAYGGYFEPTVPTYSGYNTNVLSVGILPRGATTDRIVFVCPVFEMPAKFKFYIYLTFEGGKSIMSKKYQIRDT